MAESDLISGDTGGFAKIPDQSLVTTTHIIYGLHALSIVIGLVSALTVVGAFVFGIPSIIAVIINYVNQPNARDTFLESHFRWQIRTFWFALMWILIGVVLFITIIGIPVAWVILFGAGVWVIYRVARGWLTLQDRKALIFRGAPALRRSRPGGARAITVCSAVPAGTRGCASRSGRDRCVRPAISTAHPPCCQPRPRQPAPRDRP